MLERSLVVCAKSGEERGVGKLLDLLDDLNAVVDALVNALRDDESDVRVAAARAFGPPAFNEDSERVATALSAATEDSSWAVRASAVSALARCARSSGATLPPAVTVRIAACLGGAAAGVRALRRGRRFRSHGQRGGGCAA